MATKTDSKGKTTEVSDEEMREALQNGEGIIKQVATMPDGSQKEIAIWGGYQIDGFDRTMNVFMKHEDIHTFIDIMTEEKIDPDTLKDPCEYEDGIQVSVDFLDMAAMLIFRRGQGKLSTALYSRDERRTFRDTIDAGTGEIDLNEDGTFSLDKETLEKNKFLIFALAVMGVRRYLMKEGIAQKLYDMFDESAGVVIKVSKAGKISAKIVRGMERPELPCQIFLLGEHMCRPYIDEMLGLKSGGFRKPKDPELIKKIKEADEAAKKEKAKKELASKRTSLTLTNGKLSKAKAKVAEVKEEVEPEEDKKKTIEAEVSAAETKYNQAKSELQPQIDDLEKKKKALEDVHTQEGRLYKTADEQRKKDIKANEEEVKKAQATFEVISEVADFWKAKADKGGFSKKKNQAMYSEKQAEADRAKSKVDEILKKVSDIQSKMQEENARHTSNEATYSSEKSQLDSEIVAKKNALESASSELDKAKKKLDDQAKVVDKKKKAVKEAEKEVTAIEKEIAELEKDIKKLEGK